LKKWFMVIYLANSNKKGVSSLAVARQVGVTQKTAWFMLHRIKNASVGTMFKNEFEGTTEIDEAYVGGSESNRHTKDKKLTGEKPKTVVLGMVNRETKQVKAMKVPTAEKDFLLPKINLNVRRGSTIVTDTYHAYKDLKNNFTHKSVKHSASEYVRNEIDYDGRVAFQVHTNTIEGFWSQVNNHIRVGCPFPRLSGNHSLYVLHRVPGFEKVFHGNAGCCLPHPGCCRIRRVIISVNISSRTMTCSGKYLCSPAANADAWL